jgi:hypothetical protein
MEQYMPAETRRPPTPLEIPTEPVNCSFHIQYGPEATSSRKKSEKVTDSDIEVRSNISADLSGKFNRMAATLKSTPRESCKFLSCTGEYEHSAIALAKES